MPRDARFWRNVTIIGLAHIAILIGLIRWSREAKRPNPNDIVWMEGGAGESGKVAALAKPTPNESEKTPPPTPKFSKTEEAEDKPSVAPVKSDIQIPTPTPAATPISKPSITPRPTPSVTPKPKPKPTPKKVIVAKATPKPTAKPKEKDTDDQADDRKAKKKKEIAKAALAKKKAAALDAVATGSASSGGRGSGSGASEFGWYGNMLHDRFYSEWVQPTTVVASGAKLSALVKLRIEKDGRVSDFTIIQPSGNVVVDESVAAVAKRVTHVDPLPAGLGGKYYEVRINFALNSEQ